MLAPSALLLSADVTLTPSDLSPYSWLYHCNKPQKLAGCDFLLMSPYSTNIYHRNKRKDAGLMRALCSQMSPLGTWRDSENGLKIKAYVE